MISIIDVLQRNNKVNGDVDDDFGKIDIAWYCAVTSFIDAPLFPWEEIGCRFMLKVSLSRCAVCIVTCYRTTQNTKKQSE